LRNLFTPKSNFLLKLLNDIIVLFAGCFFVFYLQCIKDDLPDSIFIVCVFDTRNWLAYFVVECKVSNKLVTFPILWVSKAWVVHVFDSTTEHQYLFTHKINVLYFCWEPWYCLGSLFLEIKNHTTNLVFTILNIWTEL